MRVRVRFAKLDKVRWTSHRDLARMMERAFRRAQLPITYTEGFSPRPKVSFGLALPTGAESVAEYLDVELASGVDVPALPARLSATLPRGVDVLVAARLEPGMPSLQQDVTSCTWRIAGVPSADVAGLLASATVLVPRERGGKTAEEDIRPGILDLAVRDGVLVAELATQPRAVRPSELLAALGHETADVRRLHQWIERDGSRSEPLPLPVAPHATERAS